MAEVKQLDILAVAALSLSVLYWYTLCARNSVIFVICAILAVKNHLHFPIRFRKSNFNNIKPNAVTTSHSDVVFSILSVLSYVRKSMFDKITEQEIYVAFRWDLWFALILNYAFCLSSDHYATQFICCSICAPHSRFSNTFFLLSLLEFSGISRENGNFNWNSHFTFHFVK